MASAVFPEFKHFFIEKEYNVPENLHEGWGISHFPAAGQERGRLSSVPTTVWLQFELFSPTKELQQADHLCMFRQAPSFPSVAPVPLHANYLPGH